MHERGPDGFSKAERLHVDDLVDFADWDCRRRESLIFSGPQGPIKSGFVLDADSLARSILGPDYENALVLDLTNSSDAWEQTCFAIRARSESLPSPDLIIGAWIEIPGHGLQIGPFVFRSTSEGSYRPVVLVENVPSLRPFKSIVLTGGFAIACFMGHPEFSHFGRNFIDCLFLSDSRIISLDVRSVISFARSILIDIDPALRAISFNLDDFSNRPRAACLSGCSLSEKCIPDAQNPLLLDEQMMSSFAGFSSVGQILRAIASASSEHDPSHLRLIRSASTEHDFLTLSSVVNK